ncbi:MAG TPA: 1-deoxy-D-xylulose-5-phosphate reductoisomerase [Candidatus Marinimicrobia bacterium]|nr:1-deoxy-D-xylulose-5-phosphate reductoisomerase [Candidatus Neomarinimicrobiota bacterium]HRS52550.1 1-deoxy-D-xylulose-5-phosphate reductoisomerase [Candidatus Neomarinimicrobiota bacterium]HRU93159.1 1-deoxy-D-xylulose-5-phosphate reductoisomerase [Candidatus Neomarinimicrobiota bacterium]
MAEAGKIKKISVLGSTGSIGVNALKVISASSDKFAVNYLTAGRNVTLLIEQAKQFHPKAVAIADESQYRLLKENLSGTNIEVLAGKDGILEIAARQDVDLVVNAIVGMAGLEPTYRALNAGRNIALSNKESLVMAGEIIMNLVRKGGQSLLPIDSEHSAIWQCLAGEDQASIKRLILTGSGGPFRTRPLTEFKDITPAEALRHPTWTMGRKITVDSATLMNKGLEIIEAFWLFGVEPEQIEVLIHPQSVIHSMVEFCDGSIKAQLGLPDMRLPIQYAIGYPERLPITWEKIDWAKLGALTFEAPEPVKFPALRIAFEALKRGGTAPAIMNVINELAVYAFLDGKIGFTEITNAIEKALTEIPIIDKPSIEDILNVEPIAREFFDNFAR